MANIRKFNEFFDSVELKNDIYERPSVPKIDNIDKLVTKIIANVEYLSIYDVMKIDDNTFAFVTDYNNDTVSITISIKPDNLYNVEIVNGESLDTIFKVKLDFDKVVALLNSDDVKKIIA